MDRLSDKAAAIAPRSGRTLLASFLPLLAVVILSLALQLAFKPWLEHLGADFTLKMLVDIGINIVLAVSLTIVNGYTGQFSLGHAAFMMVGAYLAASITYYASFRLYGDANVHGGLISTMLSQQAVPLATGADLLFIAAILAGGLFAALCGFVVGLPSLRLRGDYLAIVTLGFGEIVRVLVQAKTTDALYDPEQIAQTPWWEWPRYVGGPIGFSGLPFYNSLFWAYLLVGCTLLVAFRLKESTYGRAFLSIREDEIAAEAMGVNTTRYKVRAFVISAFFAGCAGGLFAHTVGVQLNPGELGFQKSFDIIIMVVLGGLGSISGASIAAVILTILPEALRNPVMLADGWWIGLGLLVIGLALRYVLRRYTLSRRFGILLIVIGTAILALAIIARVAIARQIDLTQYRMVLYALALILMMILRPQGIMGVRELWDRLFWRAPAEADDDKGVPA